MLGPGTGRLAIWHDIEPGAEADVLEWYNREHHAERVDVPGFRQARRHEALEAGTALFVWYGVEGPWVLQQPEYLHRVNGPTPWTRRSQPKFRNMSRTVCRVVGSGGRGQGGYCATARLASGTLEEGAVDGAIQAALGVPLVVGVELWKGIPEVSGISSAETSLRGAPDATTGHALVVSASADWAARRALTAGLGALPGADGSDVGLYRLAFALDREAA